jgi:hypothetical protein
MIGAIAQRWLFTGFGPTHVAPRSHVFPPSWLIRMTGWLSSPGPAA